MKTMRKKGFTLIELLIVVAIIGLLATFAAFALGNSRKKARDTKRTSDLRQIRKAMELAFSQGSGYPVVSTPIALGSPQYRTLCGKGTAIGFHPDKTAAYCDTDKLYIGLIPPDPSPGGAYLYQGTDDSFCIQTVLEVGSESLAAGPIIADQESMKNGTCP